VSTAYAVSSFASISLFQQPSAPNAPEGSVVLNLLGVTAMAASVTRAALQDWHRGRYASFCEPSRERLVEHALRGLDPMTSGVLLPSSQVEQAVLLFRDLIADAQPTPQVAVGEDGSVEALWLVNGTEVVLSLEPDGSGVLAASDDGDDLFEYEFEERTDPLDRAKIAEARHLLNGLGESVAHRVFA
jgi:hypothetical protein